MSLAQAVTWIAFGQALPKDLWDDFIYDGASTSLPQSECVACLERVSHRHLPPAGGEDEDYTYALETIPDGWRESLRQLASRGCERLGADNPLEIWIDVAPKPFPFDSRRLTRMAGRLLLRRKRRTWGTNSSLADPGNVRLTRLCEAYNTLRAAHLAGLVKVTGRDVEESYRLAEQNENEPCDEDPPREPLSELPSEFWLNKDGTVGRSAPDFGLRPTWYDVVMPAQDVRRLWPRQGGQWRPGDPVQSGEGGTARPGAKERWDWEPFRGEVVRWLWSRLQSSVADAKAEKKLRKELSEHMKDWSAQNLKRLPSAPLRKGEDEAPVDRSVERHLADMLELRTRPE